MLTKTARVVIYSLLVLVVLVLVGRFTFFATFVAKGSSMADTLHHGDVFFVNKMKHTPMRGDIITFHAPTGPNDVGLKRVVGMPGETLVIKGGLVYLRNGTEDTMLEEPYLNKASQGHTYRFPPTSGDMSEVVYVIPVGQYFVLGDNRESSLDSRSYTELGNKSSAFIGRETITGIAW